MFTQHATFLATDTAADAAQELARKIDELLTYGDITSAERDRLTRAANLASWCRTRLCGISATDKPVTQFHANLL